MRAKLSVHFQGEEGIDAGGVSREWYQVRAWFTPCRLHICVEALWNVWLGPNCRLTETKHVLWFSLLLMPSPRVLPHSKDSISDVSLLIDR